ncbi:MAG TPA: hypothetical protein PKE17_12730, partial [Saprospiraceae bacterium]|nr:hypothetical protein [Saprospiraceae bacterium]
DGNGAFITQILVNTTGSDQVLTYTVTPTAANGCTGADFEVEVTIKPEPVGQLLPVETCSKVALNVDLQQQIQNGLSSTFTWTVAANPNVSGASDGNGAFITQILVNTTGSDQVLTYTVTPTATNGCKGADFEVEVVVDGLEPGVIGNDQTVCITKKPATLSPIIPAASSAVLSYKWEMSTTGCDGPFSDILTGVESAIVANLVFTQPLKKTTYFRRRVFSTRDGLQCEAVNNCVIITILKVDCGAFPWSGD